MALALVLALATSGVVPVGDSAALTVLGGALSRAARARGRGSWVQVGETWVLPPPDATPWATVHFVGGAGFGSAPQLAYDELLATISRRCGVAVVAAPFDVALDHAALASGVEGRFDRGRQWCEETLGLAATAPAYQLGHSLGAKLLVMNCIDNLAASSTDEVDDDGTITILPAVPTGETAAAAGGGGRAASAAGAAPPSVGLLAFNNFGIADSARLVAQVVATAQGGERGTATAGAVMDAFGLAQMVAKATGTSIEVTPSPEELERAVARGGYAGTSPEVWRFENDELDSSEGLLTAMRKAAAAGTSPTPPPASGTTRLPGGHLAPVFFRLDPSDIDPALGLLLGGAGGFTVGSASAVAALCDEVCQWIWPMERPPPAQLSASRDATGASE